jgi:hypothetical protein
MIRLCAADAAPRARPFADCRNGVSGRHDSTEWCHRGDADSEEERAVVDYAAGAQI